MTAAWIAAAVSLLGAVLAYLGARRGSTPDQEAVTQSERDEWGRRFSTAIVMIAEDDARKRDIGFALIDALLTSNLAQPDDRAIAEAVLQVVALRGRSPDAGRTPRAVVDDLSVVEDTGVQQ